MLSIPKPLKRRADQGEGPAVGIEYVDDVTGLLEPVFQEDVIEFNWLLNYLFGLPHDQQKTELCWLFSSTRSMEYRDCVEKLKRLVEGQYLLEEDHIMLSKQYVFDRLFDIFQRPPGRGVLYHNPSGSFIGKDTWVYQFAYECGIPPEVRYPWVGTGGGSFEPNGDDKLFKLTGTVFLCDEGTDPRALYALRCTPLVGIVPKGPYLLFPQEQRVYTEDDLRYGWKKNKKLRYHSMTLVGYGVEEEIPYFLLFNSDKADWGPYNNGTVKVDIKLVSQISCPIGFKWVSG